MRTIWQSLAWKEWNEHKWKLVSIMAVMLSLLTVVLLMAGHERDALNNSFYSAVFLGGIPMAVFIGLSAAAGERSRGTLSFLQALPVPLWRVALHKISFALMTVILPVVVLAAGAVVLQVVLPRIGLGRLVDVPERFLTAGPLGTKTRYLVGAGVAILTALSLAIWAAALGNNRKDEVSAGATALVLMAIWWGVLVVSWTYFLKASVQPDTARLRAVGSAIAPLGFFLVPDIADKDQGCLALGIGTAILAHLLLIARYVARFGAADDAGNRSPRDATSRLHQAEFLPSPRWFTVTSIAWKQMRESSPVALAGLAAVVVISTAFCLGEWYTSEKWVEHASRIFSITAIIFGFFIALVAGIGVALQDVGSQLNTFWRSRPIQPDLWFWTKFLTALAVVLAAVYVPIGLFLVSGDQSIKEAFMYPDVNTIVASQVAVFAAAVMMTCLVRHAVYAAILSIAVIYIGVFAYHIACVSAYQLHLTGRASFQWWLVTTDQVLAGLCATAIVCALVAWLATRNDWGRATQ